MNHSNENLESILKIPDGARVYCFNSEERIGYTYNASLDKWIGDDNSLCGRGFGLNSNTDKYFLLTVQYLWGSIKKVGI